LAYPTQGESGNALDVIGVSEITGNEAQEI